ncbi:MAG: hypothetical protein WA001_01685 [Patescibacteria group bacterium]
MKGSHIAGIILGIVIVGGGAFYGGTIYAKSTQPAARAGRTGAAGSFAGRGTFGGGAGGAGGAAGGLTTGTVASKDANSITVSGRDGSSKVVLYSTSTTIGKMTAGTIDDVTQGANVTVMGAANSDGSITAASIQLRPAMPTGAPASGSGAPAAAPSNQ